MTPGDKSGALAGLEVVRILNEPTAASLAYGYAEGAPHTALVYDLGGGTFDVSVVTAEGDITEVLASHGNNRLGGDDFDDLLAGRLAEEFLKQHGIDLRNGSPSAIARLRWAAEEAKKTLSSQPYAAIREESLGERNGRALHLEMEISRKEYEGLIRPLVESTLDSVSKALQDAGKRPGDTDAVLLVGGSTRTPLVFELLLERIGREPRQDVHPDLCVALGAGVLASRLAGRDVNRVWWMFRRGRLASHFWASAGAVRTGTVTSRSSAAILRCRSRVRSNTSPAIRFKLRSCWRSTRGRMMMR